MVDAKSLFAEYRDRVFRYLIRMVGDRETARELTQDVFLRITRAQVPSASNIERHRAWVFSIARKVALNHLRDGRRRPETVALTDASVPATQELAAAVQQALGALQDLDRDVFLMREVGGLSYDEIARGCDLTVAAVRARLHRARTELRAALDAPLDEQRARGVKIRPPDTSRMP